LAVRWLVQAIKCQPTASVCNGGVEISEGAATMHKAFKRTGKLATQTVGLKKLPVFKVLTITHTKTSHEVIAIERYRLSEGS